MQLLRCLEYSENLKKIRELRDQSVYVECTSRANSGICLLNIESRALGEGTPTTTGISEDQIWTSEGEGPESDLNGIRAKLWC